MDSLLIAKVLAPKINGNNAIGTAYPISKDLIITARHVVDFAERDASKPISIVWIGTDRSKDESYTVQVPQGNIVFNGGEKYDVVLIRCAVPAYVEIPALSKVLPVEYQKWKSMGFPLVGKEEDGERHKVSAMGEIFPPDKYSAVLDLESKGDAKEKAGWQGISGAPVFNENNILIAVIVNTPNDMNERLRAVSIAYLIEKEQEFSELVCEKKSAENKTDLLSQEADLLPYLANRVNQELALHEKVEAYQSVQSPFICVIHGKPEECNDGFIDRIRLYSLNKIIPKQVKQGTKRYIFSCDSFKNEEELHKKMWASLGEVVVGCFAKPDEIAQAIAQQNCPVLLCVAMNSDDCLQNKGIKSLEFFLNFWKKWPASTEQSHLLLVCFSFNYTSVNPIFGLFSGVNKINKTINHYLSQQLDFAKFNLSGVVLPELTPIEQLLNFGL